MIDDLSLRMYEEAKVSKPRVEFMSALEGPAREPTREEMLDLLHTADRALRADAERDARVLALLKRIEWAGDDCCPACSASVAVELTLHGDLRRAAKTHRSACELAALIRELGGK